MIRVTKDRVKMCINEVQEVEEKLGRSSVGRDKHLRTFFRIMQEFSRSRKLNESQTGLKKKNSHVDERNYRKKKKNLIVEVTGNKRTNSLQGSGMLTIS